MKTASKEVADKIASLASAGNMTCHEIADAVGKCPKTVYDVLHERGIAIPKPPHHRDSQTTMSLHGEELRRLRAAGATLKAIGEKFGITRERVRQLTTDIPSPIPQRKWGGLTITNTRAYADWRNLVAMPSGVCEQWKEFPAFLKFYKKFKKPIGQRMIPIDDSKPAGPDNCQACKNPHDMRGAIEAFGELKPVTTWLADRRCRVSSRTLRKRLKEGWDPEDAIHLPGWTKRETVCN